MTNKLLFQTLTVRGHTFLPTGLDRNSLVIDLGAHRGEFSREIRQRFGCRCIEVEANSELLSNHADMLWAAVAERDGVTTLYLSENSEASSTLAYGHDRNGRVLAVPALSLKTILNGKASIELLKIDVEGAEIPVLLTTPPDVLRRCKQISVEFHAFCGLVSAASVVDAKTRLATLGFVEIDFTAWTPDVLFVRRDVFHPVRLWYVQRIVALRRLKWRIETDRYSWS